jgi:hypothetical protein
MARRATAVAALLILSKGSVWFFLSVCVHGSTRRIFWADRGGVMMDDDG